MKLIDDFKEKPFDPSHAESDYFWFSIPDRFIANQAVITQQHNLLRIESDPFTKTVESSTFSAPLDHCKFLAYRKEPQIIGADEMLSYQLDIQAWINGTDKHPFGKAVTDPGKDLRLASAGMSSMSMESFLIADFFVTAECIYPVYERLGIGQHLPELGQYRAFSAIGAGIARKNGDSHHLEIIYDRAHKNYIWKVDNKVVLSTVDPLGYVPTNMQILCDHGGQEQEVDPQKMHCGFGGFTLLDWMDPLNPGTQVGLVRGNKAKGIAANGSIYELPSQFIDDDCVAANRIFGQGLSLNINKLQIRVSPSAGYVN